jgi:putative membrane protein
LLGLWLWLGAGIGAGAGWMHAKLLLVLGALVYQFGCGRLLSRFEHCSNTRSHKWYRVFNEVTVLLFAATVVLVVVKPF